jgi:hypothetical protein
MILPLISFVLPVKFEDNAVKYVPTARSHGLGRLLFTRDERWRKQRLHFAGRYFMFCFGGFVLYDVLVCVFWDVTSCDFCKNRRFGRTYRLLHQGDKNL